MFFLVLLIILFFIQKSESSLTKNEVISIYNAKMENYKKSAFRAIQQINNDIRKGKNHIWKYHDKKMRYMLEKIEKTRVAVVKFLDNAKKIGIDIANIEDCVKEKISLLKDMDFNMKSGCDVDSALRNDSLMEMLDDMNERYQELKETIPKCAERHKNSCRVKKCIEDAFYKINRDFDVLFWTSKKEIVREIKYYERCADDVVQKLKQVTEYILQDIKKC